MRLYIIAAFLYGVNIVLGLPQVAYPSTLIINSTEPEQVHLASVPRQNFKVCPILHGLKATKTDNFIFTIFGEGKHREETCISLENTGEMWNQGFHHTFAKYASTQNIAISSCQVSEGFTSGDQRNLDLCLKQTAPSIGVFINSGCLVFQKIMDYASESVMFDSKRKWLIIEDEETSTGTNITSNEPDFMFNETNYVESTGTRTIEILNNLNLAIDADITLSIKNDNSSYDLYEVYNFGKARNGAFVIENIGDWNSVTGLNISKEFKYTRRWDFRQMAFAIVVVVAPLPPLFNPEVILSRTQDNSVPIITKTSTMILHELTGIHNFRYNYTVVDRWVGDYVKEHKAVTNALYFKEQDITPVLRMLPHHFGRYDVVAPAVSFIETRFFYRIPSQGVGKFENQFLRPLSTGTWWCVVGICVLCCIVLLLSAVVEHRPINVYYSIFSVLALICQQFFEEFEDIRRISAARKMTILVTGLSCLLIYNYYTSSVVSWLLNGPPPSINTLWELLESPLKPVFEDVGYTYSWLQLPDYYYNRKKMKAEDELKRRLNSMAKKGKSIVASINDGIELVRNGGYAYHVEINAANARIAQTFDQRELCDLDSLHSMEHVLLYSCVQKNSPYREFFSWSLARLLERGVINCIHERTWVHELKCAGSSPRALALGGAAPAFILLAAGFVLGTVIMLLERLWWKYVTKNKTRLQKNKKEEKFWGNLMSYFRK